MKASLKVVKLIEGIIILGSLLWVAGCSGGNGTSTPLSPTAQGAAVTVNVGDAPSDSVVALEVMVTSITLTNDKNETVSVLSKPTEIELRHLAGAFQPVSFTSVPAGTYKQANVQVSSVDVTVLDAKGKPVEKSIPAPSSPVAVKFTAPLVVTTQASTVNLEFNLSSSILIDSAGNISFSPVVTATASTVPQDGQHEDDSESGQVEGVVGKVASVSSSSFTISVFQSSQPLTFSTDASTKFEGITGLSGLTSGMIVEVVAVTRADGTLVATKVETHDEGQQGMEAEGLVVSTTGSPVTQFGIVVHDRSNSANSPTLGSTLAVTVDSNTQFQIDQNQVDLAGLSFSPVFDANALVKGQSVEADLGTSGTAPAAAAKKVRLKKQGLSGTVSGLAQSGATSTFTLTVASDSAFATLTGKTTVQVFQQSSTKTKTTLSNGAVIQVRGLLFSSAGNYNLVATRVNSH